MLILNLSKVLQVTKGGIPYGHTYGDPVANLLSGKLSFGIIRHSYLLQSLIFVTINPENRKTSARSPFLQTGYSRTEIGFKCDPYHIHFLNKSQLKH